MFFKILNLLPFFNKGVRRINKVVNLLTEARGELQQGVEEVSIDILDVEEDIQAAWAEYQSFKSRKDSELGEFVGKKEEALNLIRSINTLLGRA